MNIDVSLFSSCSHVTIKTRKVDPRAEGGARILIKESSIKVIEKCRDESSLEKSSTDIIIKINNRSVGQVARKFSVKITKIPPFLNQNL